MNLREKVRKIAERAKKASIQAALLDSQVKNRVLSQVAGDLRRQRAEIFAANRRDLDFARKEGLSSAMMDRLMLDEKRIEDMARSVEGVIRLKDPIGHVLEEWKRPNGLVIQKVSVPLGVIVIIYEARPNVTSECASLCLKSGNSVILRGGREAFHSNQAIASIYRCALKRHKVTEDAVILVETPDRRVIDELIQLEDLVNLVIPRGGEALIRRVSSKSRVPVIKHYKGICHVFVDDSADLEMAEKIVLNAKVQRPGVCNAMETLLIHEKVAPKFLPRIGDALRARGCELRGDPETRKWIHGIRKATEEDWRTEYLDLILSVRVVKNIHEAIEHIQKYGSAHTDAIVTRNKKSAEEFVKEVDSSSVMVNTSTRFSDGYQYGLGAEIGISTDKVHARGPMGLEGLTSYKYVVRGKGQVRA